MLNLEVTSYPVLGNQLLWYSLAKAASGEINKVKSQY